MPWACGVQDVAHLIKLVQREPRDGPARGERNAVAEHKQAPALRIHVRMRGQRIPA